MGDSADTSNDDNKAADATDGKTAATPETPTTPPEVKVVAVGGSNGSQPDINAIVSRRVNKLNSVLRPQIDHLAAKNDNLNGDLATANQRIGLMQMQIDQLNATNASASAPMPPDPINFDDGAADPKYVSALNEFTDARVTATVKRQLADQQPAPVTQGNGHSESKQRAHYQRAHELGASDFDAMESKAMDVLGRDTVLHLIDVAPNSELLVYFFGKNPERAQYYRDQIVANPLQGVWELAQFTLEKEEPAQTNAPPNPDTALDGVTPTGTGDDEAYQKKLAKLRETAAETRDMTPVMEFKRQYQARLAATA